MTHVLIEHQKWILLFMGGQSASLDSVKVTMHPTQVPSAAASRSPFMECPGGTTQTAAPRICYLANLALGIYSAFQWQTRGGIYNPFVFSLPISLEIFLLDVWIFAVGIHFSMGMYVDAGYRNRLTSDKGTLI